MDSLTTTTTTISTTNTNATDTRQSRVGSVPTGRISTVQQVRELDNAISKCDRLLDRAVMRGNLEASIRHDAVLRELTDLMSAVSDRLWSKYCEQLMLAEEEV